MARSKKRAIKIDAEDDAKPAFKSLNLDAAMGYFKKKFNGSRYSIELDMAYFGDGYDPNGEMQEDGDEWNAQRLMERYGGNYWSQALQDFEGQRCIEIDGGDIESLESGKFKDIMQGSVKKAVADIKQCADIGFDVEVWIKDEDGEHLCLIRVPNDCFSKSGKYIGGQAEFARDFRLGYAGSACFAAKFASIAFFRSVNSAVLASALCRICCVFSAAWVSILLLSSSVANGLLRTASILCCCAFASASADALVCSMLLSIFSMSAAALPASAAASSSDSKAASLSANTSSASSTLSLKILSFTLSDSTKERSILILPMSMQVVYK